MGCFKVDPVTMLLREIGQHFPVFTPYLAKKQKKLKIFLSRKSARNINY